MFGRAGVAHGRHLILLETLAAKLAFNLERREGGEAMTNWWEDHHRQQTRTALKHTNSRSRECPDLELAAECSIAGGREFCLIFLTRQWAFAQKFLLAGYRVAYTGMQHFLRVLTAPTVGAVTKLDYFQISGCCVQVARNCAQAERRGSGFRV